MKFVIISDAHGQHRDLILAEGDFIIHAGDISRSGEEAEIRDFLRQVPYSALQFMNASVLEKIII